MQPLTSLARRVLATLPADVSFEADAVRRLPVPEVKAESDPLFLSTVRANLHAAARHAALGHASTSFRECRGSACLEAAKLVPELNPSQGAATEAELDAILDQVLVRLEREGTPFLAAKPS